MIRRAVEAGYRPRSFLLARALAAGLADVLERWPDVPVYVVDEALAEEVTGLPRPPRGARVAAPGRALQPSTICSAPSAGRDRGRRRPHQRRRDHPLRRGAGLGRCAALAPRPPTRSTAVRSRSAWARCSVCRGPGCRTGPAAPDLLRAAGLQTVALTLADDAVDLAVFAAGSGRSSTAGDHAGHRGRRAVRALGAWRGRPGEDRHAGRHRLAQRRRRRGGRLLRPRAEPATTCGPSPPRSERRVTRSADGPRRAARRSR